MTKTRLGYWIPALVILLVCVAQSIHAGDAETLQAIRSAYENREEHLNPVWIRYRLTVFESAVWQKAYSHTETPRDVHWTDEGEYARKGTKRRSWCRIGRPSNDGGGENFFIFTGAVEVSKLGKNDTYEIRQRPENLFAAETPFFLAGETHLTEGIRDWAAGKIASTTITEEHEGDGQRVVVVDWRYPNKGGGKCRLLPDEGWVPRRIDIYNDKRLLVNSFQVREFGAMNGLVYPKSGRLEYHLPSGEICRSQDFEVQSMETQASRIPDSLFQVEIPKGADVYDDDLKMRVRNTEGVESHLNEVVAQAAGHERWSWWVWPSIGFAVVAVALFAFRFFRLTKAGAVKTTISPGSKG